MKEVDYNKYYILDEEKLDKIRHALDIAFYFMKEHVEITKSQQ